MSNNGGSSFDNSTGPHAFDPRFENVVTNERGQVGTDQFWQWSAFTSKGQLAVDYYDRQYGHDETNGSSDFSLSGSQDLSNFGQVRVTSSSMPAPTQFEGPAGGQFYGDYIGLAAIDKAHPIWSDTRSPDLFVCPGTATPGTAADPVRGDGGQRPDRQRRGELHRDGERALLGSRSLTR